MKALHSVGERLLPWLLAVATVACSPQSHSPDHAILAEVGDSPITEETLRHWWSKTRPASDSLETRQELLERIVRHTQAVRRARSLGLDSEPAVRDAIEAVLVARLQETRLKPALASLKVSEEESRACYEELKETQFRVPERAHVAALWLDTRGIAPLAARYQAKLESVRAQLTSQVSGTQSDDAGFGEWAITHSEHRPSRFKGGDIGWVDLDGTIRDPWGKAVAEIAATLNQPGEVSSVVVRDEGVFLVRLIAASPARIRSFEEVRARVEKLVLSRKQEAVRQEFDRWIAKEGPVRFHPNSLAAVSELSTEELTPPPSRGIVNFTQKPPLP